MSVYGSALEGMGQLKGFRSNKQRRKGQGVVKSLNTAPKQSKAKLLEIALRDKSKELELILSRSGMH